MRANSSAYPRRAAVGTLKQKAARCYMEITAGNYHGNYTGVEMKGSEISKEQGIITVPNESPANAVHHVAQAHKA